MGPNGGKPTTSKVNDQDNENQVENRRLVSRPRSSKNFEVKAKNSYQLRAYTGDGVSAGDVTFAI